MIVVLFVVIMTFGKNWSLSLSAGEQCKEWGEGDTFLLVSSSFDLLWLNFPELRLSNYSCVKEASLLSESFRTLPLIGYTLFVIMFFSGKYFHPSSSPLTQIIKSFKSWERRDTAKYADASVSLSTRWCFSKSPLQWIEVKTLMLKN
jgi:hypothetical protein